MLLCDGCPWGCHQVPSTDECTPSAKSGDLEHLPNETAMTVLWFSYWITMSSHIVRFTMGAIIGCSPSTLLLPHAAGPPMAPCKCLFLCASILPNIVSPGDASGGKAKLDLVLLHVWDTVGIVPGEPMGAFRSPGLSP